MSYYKPADDLVNLFDYCAKDIRKTASSLAGRFGCIEEGARDNGYGPILVNLPSFYGVCWSAPSANVLD